MLSCASVWRDVLCCVARRGYVVLCCAVLCVLCFDSPLRKVVR